MADEVMFGTPETWGMKVGEFLESKEYTIPQPKPQDVIEQRRKERREERTRRMDEG